MSKQIDQLYQSLQLDQSQVLRFQNLKTPFPRHYHETYCISYVAGGTEVVELEQKSLYGPPGSFSITQPGEVHANPLLAQKEGIDFTTLYLNPEIVCWALDLSTAPRFVCIQAATINQYNRFWALTHRLLSNKPQSTSELRTFLSCLSIETEPQLPRSAVWRNEIETYVDQKIHQNISLDELARITLQSRFAFARNFRHEFGISPGQYVLMRKVFASQALLRQGMKPSTLALEMGFTDAAHYGRTFKRFVGLTPGRYQSQVSDKKQDCTKD